MLTVALLPDPIWPVIVLAVIQFIDGILCVKPVAFIAKCFEDVQWPREYWWAMAPLKFVAAAALLVGIWVPILALAASAALVVYFATAIGFHLRARDFGRNLFLNATGMLVICIATTLLSFVRVA